MPVIRDRGAVRSLLGDAPGEPVPLWRSVDDAVDSAALEDFENRYGQVRFAPVVVLIPAFQEADNIDTVVGGIPGQVLGLDLDTVVVTDGCTDDTAPRARRAGAYVCEARVNRGQGSAFRLGYRLLAHGGARYVVTLDADGQYDPADIERLLEPVLAGEADFAQGSRLLGAAEKDDRFRMAGVYFFAALISLLLGRRVTDSSNGLRVLRIEVPSTVRLVEDQYQSSEMLISAVRCGFRYVERPVTVRRRMSGESKKARNTIYGLQYLRVVLRSRFRRTYRRPEAKPVLRVVSPTGPGRRAVLPQSPSRLA